MADRRALEERLLGDPFDRSTREEYAELLMAEEAFAASAQQWQLVLKQHATSAKPHLRLAHCQKKLGQKSEAEREIAVARTCGDFDPADPMLDSLMDVPSEGAKGPQRLRVVGGEKRSAELAEVIDLSSAKVRFHDVVGMEELKKVLRLRIIEPFLRPGLFERFKKKSGGGVLLYGPPGCGKTMIARAIANECHAKFSSVGISEILNMWIGESERNLATLFQKARSDTPGVLFFDELDALAFSRSKASSDHTRTLVNEFLSQIDGMAGNNDKLLVLAATNMPWDVDEAMKRPGRFDRQVFVPPPDAAARTEMFRTKLRGVPTGHRPRSARRALRALLGRGCGWGARACQGRGVDADAGLDRGSAGHAGGSSRCHRGHEPHHDGLDEDCAKPGEVRWRRQGVSGRRKVPTGEPPLLSPPTKGGSLDARAALVPTSSRPHPARPG